MKTNRGFTVIEIVLVIGISSIVGLMTFGLFQLAMKNFKGMDSWTSFSGHQGVLQKYFSNLNTIKNTIEHNPSMECLKNRSTCSENSKDIPFVLYDSSLLGSAKPVEMFNQAENYGMTANGEACTTYPTGDCNFRYLLTWEPICSGQGLCRSPAFRLRGTLKSQLNPPPFKLSNFNVEVVRAAAGQEAKALCAELKGNYDAANEVCKMDLFMGCEKGELFVGMDSSNHKKCVELATQSCPAGSVIQSISADGTVRCTNGCYTDLGSSGCTFNMWTMATNCPQGVVFDKTNGGIIYPPNTTAKPLLNSDPSAVVAPVGP